MNAWASTIAPDGAGIGLTVAVRNRGTREVGNVKLEGPGTDRGRTIAVIRAGASSVFRCRTAAVTDRDRTHRFTAREGGRTHHSQRIQVRSLVHSTGYWSQYLPNAPTGGPAGWPVRPDRWGLGQKRGSRLNPAADPRRRERHHCTRSDRDVQR